MGRALALVFCSVMLGTASADDVLRAAPKCESANLDVLRTVAVMMVVVSHFLQFFQLTQRGDFIHQLGYWGVLLFFVHTSLVLMLSLERHSAERYQSPYFAFVARRIFRIYPLSVAVVAAVCMFHWPVANIELGRFVALAADWKTKGANVLLIQNLTHSRSVMGPLWTLPFEMQMYLLLPLLFLVARARHGVTLLLTVWVLAALLARALHGRREDLVLYVPFFVSGTIGYKLLKLGRGSWPFGGWLVLLLLMTLLFLKHGTETAASVDCLIVGVMASRFRELQASWLRRTCQLVARYSYGIYLSHYICIWFAFQRVTGIPRVGQWGLFFVCATLTPVVMYHVLEEPMIAFGSRWVRGFKRAGVARRA